MGTACRPHGGEDAAHDDRRGRDGYERDDQVLKKLQLPSYEIPAAASDW